MSSPSDLEPPKDLRSRRREATRQEILQAAQDVFVEVGFHEGRMEIIAARAGVSVGTLYNYFQDRAELIATLWKQHHDHMLSAIQGVVQDTANMPATEQIRAFIRTMLQQVQQRRAFFERSMDMGSSEPEVNKGQLFADTMRGLYQAAETVVNRCVAVGALRAEDAPLLPAMLLGLIRGVLVVELVRKQPDVTEVTEPVLHFFMHGAVTAPGDSL